MADRDIPEEMVEAALLGAMGFDAVQDDDCPKDDAYFVAQMRAALSAALAGRTVVDTPDDGHCSKCGQPFSDEVRDVVLEPRLPFDARDRIERTLRASELPTNAGAIAHRIMLALTHPAAGSGVGDQDGE